MVSQALGRLFWPEPALLRLRYSVHVYTNSIIILYSSAVLVYGIMYSVCSVLCAELVYVV